MRGWLRRLVVRWLDLDRDDGRLEVATGEGPRSYVVVNSIGLCLLGQSEDGSTRVILPEHVADQAKFARLWKRYNRGGEIFMWEDGTRFRPFNEGGRSWFGKLFDIYWRACSWPALLIFGSRRRGRPGRSSLRPSDALPGPNAAGGSEKGKGV